MAQKSNGKSGSSNKTPVRNTAIPRTQPRAQQQQPSQSRQSQPQQQQGRQVTQEQIAKRAYEIWRSGKGGNEQDNWLRAERELRGF